MGSRALPGLFLLLRGCLVFDLWGWGVAPGDSYSTISVKPLSGSTWAFVDRYIIKCHLMFSFLLQWVVLNSERRMCWVLSIAVFMQLKLLDYSGILGYPNSRFKPPFNLLCHFKEQTAPWCD